MSLVLREESEHVLSVEAEHYLLKMNALLCNDISVMLNLVEMKAAFKDEDFVYYRQLWHDFTETEQRLLYKAPSKGGLFTTAERKALRG